MDDNVSSGWAFTTPNSAGFSADLEERLEIARQAGVLPNLHGVVAAHGGRIFLERYFAGPDAERGKPLGVVRFGPDTLHDLPSVSKSIVGLLRDCPGCWPSTWASSSPDRPVPGVSGACW